MSKITYILTAISVVIALLIATRVDEKIFNKKSTADLIRKKADTFTDKMTETRKNLEKISSKTDFNQFKMEDPTEKIVAVETNISETVVQVVEEKKTTLRVSGIMKSSEGSIMATVEGSLVLKGDMVRGCEVLEVTDKGIRFDVAGESVFVPVNTSYSFATPQANSVTLDKIENKNGQNFAIIRGRFYKAGDWVDVDTQVKAVTPTMVMFSVKNKSLILKPGETAPQETIVPEEPAL